MATCSTPRVRSGLLRTTTSLCWWSCSTTGPCPYQKLFRPSHHAATRREVPLTCPVVWRFPCRCMRRCIPQRLLVDVARRSLALSTSRSRPAGSGALWGDNQWSGGSRSHTPTPSTVPRGQTAGPEAVALGCIMVTASRHEAPRHPLATNLSSPRCSVWRIGTEKARKFFMCCA